MANQHEDESLIWARDAVRRMLVRLLIAVSQDYALLARLAARK